MGINTMYQLVIGEFETHNKVVLFAKALASALDFERQGTRIIFKRKLYRPVGGATYPAIYTLVVKDREMIIERETMPNPKNLHRNSSEDA